MNYTQIYKEIKQGIKVDKPLSLKGKILSNDDANKLIREQLKPFLKQNANIFYCDGLYFTTTKDCIDELLSEFNNMYKYTPNNFDCDKFAMIFKAFLILSFRKTDDTKQDMQATAFCGFLTFEYTDKDNKRCGHAINVVLEQQEKAVKVNIIEPQLPKMFDFNEYCKQNGFTDVKITNIIV